MEAYQIVLISVAALLLAGCVILRIINKSTAAYYPILTYIVKFLGYVVKGVSGAFPNAHLVSILSVVIEASIKAVSSAERMWMEGAIPKEQRNKVAKEYILDVVDQANIMVTPVISQIIDGAIAFVCYLLPHEEPNEDALEDIEIVIPEEEEEEDVETMDYLESGEDENVEG